MVQIRNVPDELQQKLKARAARSGMSMSDYLLQELRRWLERPTREELLRRLATRSPTHPRPSPGDAIDAERNHR